MPAFGNPISVDNTKRKHDSTEDWEVSQRKRHAGPSVASNKQTNSGGGSRESYWMVQWRNPQYKKNKTWDGDGVLVVASNGFCSVYDMDNRRITSGKSSIEFTPDTEFVLGGKDVGIDHALTKEDYLSGRCFGGLLASPQPPIRNSGSAVKPYNPPLLSRSINKFKAPSYLQPRASSSKAKETETPTEKSQSTTAHVDVKAENTYWTANWRKPQQRKHKTWDGDAYVVHEGQTLTLVSEKGVIRGTRKWDGNPLFSGYGCLIGGKEVELDSQISQNEMPAIVGKSEELIVDLEYGDPPSTQEHTLQIASRSRVPSPTKSIPSPSTSTPGQAAPAKSFYQLVKPKPKTIGPLYDPLAEGALVMKEPSEEQSKKQNKRNAPIVPVVIDPVLARHLRPHQVEGVKFMYECVMGLRHGGEGCILADEMGMGKTLQTITLVWTLLRQNCYGTGKPAVGRALIVCPVSLINNWKSEFHKWLGKDRVGILVGDKDKNTILQFQNSRVHRVLIIGYERLRTVIEDLAHCVPPIELIICDEGHRLKSGNNKTSAMFQHLRTKKRIILSGTPIQNDLSEFHSMADFCNEDLLGDYPAFRKQYETPIMKSRAPGCAPMDKEMGEERLRKLMNLAQQFVLRRDATILKRYLPPKYEYVVFITPTQLQRDMFQRILTRDNIDNLSNTSTAESLALINLLTKISNSPILLKATADSAKNKGGQKEDVIKKKSIEDALKLLPEKAKVEDVSLSGKLAALAMLLRAVYKDTDEKCIVVSHYTSTLNIIEVFCKKKHYSFHRLDGQTPAHKRQEYVNDFNRSSQKSRFVFLLSSKAGGVGLNLIGASRLVLIDSDWNPSHDLQSMARIHRDGQKRTVFIYRFLTAGTIDEKIFQRQVTKLGLSDSLIGNKSSESKSDSFTRKDLRDIFTIHPNTSCHTHDLLECPCGDIAAANPTTGDQHPNDTDNESEEERPVGFMSASNIDQEHMDKMDRAYLKQKKAQLAALGQWTHIDCLKPNALERIQDDLLHQLLSPKLVSAVVPDDGAAERSRIENIFAASDLNAVLAATEAKSLTVNDVPGGTVSFVFERSANSVNETNDEEADETYEDSD
ncbi:P-loop containing nucleoside triphosphate hydrolase protein [Abortiporus biennis]|nr:P-loop containing nucleoside triphosphate hydrolase protein [Abortiporus biennis]